MPHFAFPQGPKGWAVVIAGAVVGLVSGGLAINALGRLLGE